jgi:hypothetical protein
VIPAATMINDSPPDPPPAPGRRHGGEAGLFVLLLLAVAVAITFCWLYVAGPPAAQAALPPGRIDRSDRSDREQATPSPFEETSLIVEHVVVVEDPAAGTTRKVLAQVPARYASGTLRWTPAQAAEANAIRNRLAAIQRYQGQLAAELARLEADWQELLRAGLPAEVLRPDSPSLPQPQEP